MGDGADATDNATARSVDGHDDRAVAHARVGRVDNGGDRADDARARNAVTPIPGSIVKAICQIMVTVDAVKKSNRNQHGNYNFASTDDIYAAVTRKMGEVGLVVMALEDVCEIKRFETEVKGEKKTAQWAHMVFSFVLATETDTWSDPRAKRTLYLQVTGAQTFQAAQSYAEKSYLRSLYKLPSGDMDLDSMPQADNEDDQINLNSPRKPKSSSRAKKDGDDVAFNELRGAISGSEGPADLARIKRDHFSFWNALPKEWHNIVEEEYKYKLAEFDQLDAAE